MTSERAHMGELVRVRGTVASLSAPGPARLQIRIGRRSVQRTVPGSAVIEVAGGDAVRMEVSSTVELIGATHEQGGPLGRLAALAGFPDDLGPPDTEVKLSVIAPAVGAEVAVQGEVTGADDGVATVRAVLVACGPAAGDLLDAVLARRQVRDRERRWSAPPPLSPATPAAPTAAAAAAPRWPLPVIAGLVAILVALTVLLMR